MRSYSRFEECIISLLIDFFLEEKDIANFSEWLNNRSARKTPELEYNFLFCPEDCYDKKRKTIC